MNEKNRFIYPPKKLTHLTPVRLLKIKKKILKGKIKFVKKINSSLIEVDCNNCSITFRFIA